MNVAVILPAAGLGRRFRPASDHVPGEMASASTKIESDLRGKPVFLHAVELFLNRADVGSMILAVNPATIDDFRSRWGQTLGFHGVTVIAGGTRERWETVLRALEAVPEACTHIAIHDAARPLASATLVDRVFAAARQHLAVIPGMPVTSTLKRVAEAREAAPGTVAAADPIDAILGDPGDTRGAVRRVMETVDRQNLVEVQTPQVFDAALLRRAYALLAEGRLDGGGITDDARLVEALGEPVVAVEGESTNLKITRPADLELAAALMDRRASATRSKDAARQRLFGDDEDD